MSLLPLLSLHKYSMLYTLTLCSFHLLMYPYNFSISNHSFFLIFYSYKILYYGRCAIIYSTNVSKNMQLSYGATDKVTINNLV